MRKKEAKRSARSPDLAALSDLSRWLALFTWRLRFGWAVVVIAGVTLAAASIALMLFFPHMPRRLGRIPIYLLMGAWFCLGLLLAMARRRLWRPGAEWGQLGGFGKLGRVILTLLGTAVMLSPFAWVAWRVLR